METKYISMFHIILGFKNEDKDLFRNSSCLFLFSEDRADGYKNCEFQMIMSDNFLIPTTWRY